MYAKVVDGVVVKYPYTLASFYEDNPGKYFSALDDAVLNAHGAVRVVVTGYPQQDHTKDVVEGTPVFNEERNRWEQSWVVVDAKPEDILQRTEAKASDLRSQRNLKISLCDWTQLPDAPVNKEAWAAYRQALRDITKQDGFPWDIQWPLSPDEQTNGT